MAEEVIGKVADGNGSMAPGEQGDDSADGNAEGH
jgi:hypothetical protein